ncbi:MAG: MFS transporter [Geminicoccaceae bacterium]
MTAALPARAVALLAFASFVSASTLRATDPLLPAIAAELGATPGTVGLTVAAFTLAYGFCQLAWGPVGDRFGKYRVVALACLLSAVTTAAVAAAHSLAMLAAARLLSGVTASAIISLSVAFIGDHVPYERRQATLGHLYTGQISGLIGGQLIGGGIGGHLGWRAVFLVLAALFLLAAILLWLELRAASMPPPVLREPTPQRELVLGYLRFARRPWPRLVLLTVLAESILFFGAFAYAGLALHTTFGLGFGLVGLILGAFGLGGLLYVLTARALMRRLGERGLARTGGMLLALGYLALALAPAPWLAAAAVALLGLGFYMLHTTLVTVATQLSAAARGQAVASFGSCAFIGQGLGAWLGGLVVDGPGTMVLFLAVAPLLLLLGLGFARRMKHRPAS